MFLFIESFLVITGYFSHNNGIFSEIFTIYFFRYYEVVLVITRSFLLITRSFLVITISFLVITRSFLVITKSFFAITRSYFVITIYFFVITRNVSSFYEKMFFSFYLCVTPFGFRTFFVIEDLPNPKLLSFFLSQSVRTYKS